MSGGITRARCLLAVLGASAVTHTPAAEDFFEVEGRISLGEVAGRIDHLTYDARRMRLYVAELGNNTVGIVDLGTRRLIRTVDGFDEPQGVAYEPTTDSVYVSNGGNGHVDVFNAGDFSQVATISTGGDADNIRVDRAAGQVFVGYGDGALLFIDAKSRKKVGEIALPGHPENFQISPDGDRIFVNVPDVRQIVVASRKSNRVIGNWPMQHGANYPLAIDTTHDVILSAFRTPSRLETFDPTTGSPLGGVASCGDADDVFVDSKRGTVYVICGDGTVDTYAWIDHAYRRIAQLAIPRGSRTGLFLPDHDRLVVAIRSSDRKAAAVWILRPTSPTSVAASGEILFVCEHGNVKSLMAASYFNQMAHERKLPYRAVSRGTAPDSTTVPPAIVSGLGKDGVDVAAFRPAAVEAADITASRMLVLIGTELPANLRAQEVITEHWTDVPPASVNFDAARESLKSHVARLIDQLERSSPK
jgi:YVTN family beta-propeller protein